MSTSNIPSNTLDTKEILERIKRLQSEIVKQVEEAVAKANGDTSVLQACAKVLKFIGDCIINIIKLEDGLKRQERKDAEKADREKK